MSINPIIIALKQGAINKKPTKVYAHYCENILAKEGKFTEEIFEEENDIYEKHAQSCQCELCLGNLFMGFNPEKYMSFRKSFIEVISKDVDRLRIPSPDLSKLIIEHERTLLAK
jgi:hypothetical protein